MIVKLNERLHRRYPEFITKAFTLESLNSSSFELTDDKKEIINLNCKESLQNATLMTEFYKIVGSSMKCHIETLLKSYIKKNRFKSNNYLVDLVLYLELSTGLLMGIHDLKYINDYIEVYLADGKESFTHISRKIFHPIEDSICLKDSQKIFASLTEGPDISTKVTNFTKEAIILVFLPPKLDNIILVDKLRYIKNILKNESVKNINNCDEI